MKYSFQQGWLDSLCGIYSIVNAEKIVNKSSASESQKIFNLIIEYLSKKRILEDIIIGGVWHKNLLDIMENIMFEFVLYKTNTNGFYKIDDWWAYAYEFMQEPHRAIILSIGGKENHLTVIEKMTEKVIYLSDSSEIKSLRKSACKLFGYKKDGKYIVYPNQCFYVSKP